MLLHLILSEIGVCQNIPKVRDRRIHFSYDGGRLKICAVEFQILLINVDIVSVYKYFRILNLRNLRPEIIFSSAVNLFIKSIFKSDIFIFVIRRVNICYILCMNCLLYTSDAADD